MLITVKATLPQPLLDDLDQAAAEEGVKRTEILRRLLAQALERRQIEMVKPAAKRARRRA